MKKPGIYLKEYCQRLSDEQLKFLSQRLSRRLSGDLPEVLDFLSNVKEIDRWLAGAEACFELYDMIDLVDAAVDSEIDRRWDLAA